jgi:hypothetical protein
LGHSPDATKAEFSEQRALADFLEESGAKVVGDLKHGAKHSLGQRVKNPRSSVFIGGQHSCAAVNRYLSTL